MSVIYSCLFLEKKKIKKKDFLINIFFQLVSRTFAAKIKSLYRAVEVWDIIE